MRVHKVKIALLALTAFGSSVAHAEVHIPNTRVSYTVEKDLMTDENMSYIFIDEVNDTGGFNYLGFRCSTNATFVFSINTKQSLLATGEADYDSLDALLDTNYLVSYRVGTNPPASVRDLAPAFLNSKLVPRTTLFYDANANSAIGQGLTDGEKITIRIQSISDNALVKGKLDYVFAAKGFYEAFKAVNYCK